MKRLRPGAAQVDRRVLMGQPGRSMPRRSGPRTPVRVDDVFDELCACAKSSAGTRPGPARRSRPPQDGGKVAAVPPFAGRAGAARRLGRSRTGTGPGVKVVAAHSRSVGAGRTVRYAPPHLWWLCPRAPGLVAA